jgi:BirA family biotin operon repressor/biotin-[acetyl-CoA-carboxylase] ligase
VSRPGNLYCTLLWPTMAEASHLSQLSFVAAVAVHDTATSFASPGAISLKWPNDGLLHGAKFCGILAEVIAPGLVAIGVGINIAHVPEGLPYKAARLAGADVESVFQHFAASLSKWLEIWDEGRGFAAIARAWEARCPSLGKAITVNGLAGTFKGLGPDGALLLRLESGQTHAIYAGDVRVEYDPQP